MKKSSVIKGAIILTVAGLITRVLGFVNRIYLSNIIGAEGMGLYQLVFPVYMICYTICCSGIFTAVSKLAAEEKAKNNFANMKRIVKTSCVISLSLAIFLMIVLYFNAGFISMSLMKEPRTELAFKIIAFSIPFTAMSSCIKGYFYGLQYPTIPAISQVLEQIVRISAIYFLASFFVPMGLTYACAMAVFSMTLGEIVACIMVVISYKFNNFKELRRKKPNRYIIILKKISSIAIPLTSNRLITTLLISIEMILIPKQLQLFGFNHSNALSIFGILTGMALPLIQFPTIFTNSVSLMLLPTVSAAAAYNNKRLINMATSKTMKFTILIGIISSFLFLSFGKILGEIIYNEEYVGTLLTILAWICPFIYLQTTLASILNGLNLQLISFRNNVIGLAIRISFIYLLIPLYGLTGYLWGLLASSILVAFLHILHLIKVTSINFRVGDWILKPIIVCTASLSSIYVFNRMFQLQFSTTINTLIYICIYLVLLIPFLVLSGCVTTNEIKFIFNKQK